MLKGDWNALRAGDEVLVHDETDPPSGLRPGKVVEVLSTAAYGSSRVNDVSIHLDKAKPGVLVRPGRFAVHRAPLGETEPCWRCTGEVPLASTAKRRR